MIYRRLTMRKPIVEGVGLLSLIFALGSENAQAQMGVTRSSRPSPGWFTSRPSPAGSASGTAATTSGTVAVPYPLPVPNDVGVPGPGGYGGVRQVRMVQEGTLTPNQFAPPGTGPAPSPSGTLTQPTSPNPSE